MNTTNTEIVYVVDDDEAVRRSLLMLLFPQGLAVQGFASGEDFLAAVDPQQPGCVILDLRLGGMSGLQVFERLREARRDPYSINRLLRHRASAYKEVFGAADFFPANSFLDAPMASKAKMVEAMRVGRENLLRAGILHPEP